MQDTSKIKQLVTIDPQISERGARSNSVGIRKTNFYAVFGDALYNARRAVSNKQALTLDYVVA